MSRPQKHHYIPVFYTKRWATHADGKLCQFSRPYREIKPLRVHPEATGWVRNLYALEGFSPELAQQVEERFFAPVDSRAADALTLMERFGTSAKWTSELRTGWTRFIQSILIRMPEDIDKLKKKWKSHMIEIADLDEMSYQECKVEDDPETFREYLESLPPDEWAKDNAEVLMRLIDQRNTGAYINHMIWHVIDVPDTENELLTSDRAVIRSGLKERRGHIGLPIGPRKLWLALREGYSVDISTRKKRERLVAEVNAHTVGSAVKFVYGTNDRQLRFVANRFGRRPEVRLVDGLTSPPRRRL